MYQRFILFFPIKSGQMQHMKIKKKEFLFRSSAQIVAYTIPPDCTNFNEHDGESRRDCVNPPNTAYFLVIDYGNNNAALFFFYSHFFFFSGNITFRTPKLN